MPSYSEEAYRDAVEKKEQFEETAAREMRRLDQTHRSNHHPQSSEPAEIDRLMGMLDSAAAELNERFELLRSRINPVLRDSFPESGDDIKSPDSIESDLGKALYDHALNLQQLITRIQGITERVAL